MIRVVVALLAVRRPHSRSLGGPIHFRVEVNNFLAVDGISGGPHILVVAGLPHFEDGGRLLIEAVPLRGLSAYEGARDQFLKRTMHYIFVVHLLVDFGPLKHHSLLNCCLKSDLKIFKVFVESTYKYLIVEFYNIAS